MEVITLENKAFSELLTKIEVLIAETQVLNHRLTIDRSKYLTAAEVGAITGYAGKTIKMRKSEIGYIDQGGELKFKRDDIDKWMMKFYVQPT